MIIKPLRYKVTEAIAHNLCLLIGVLKLAIDIFFYSAEQKKNQKHIFLFMQN